MACGNFALYIWGNGVTIYTEHQPLVSVFHRRTKSGRMNGWILEMRGHTYKMKYMKGKQNFAADMLWIPVFNVKVITGNADIFGLSVEEFNSKEGETDKWMAVIHDLEVSPYQET